MPFQHSESTARLAPHMEAADRAEKALRRLEHHGAILSRLVVRAEQELGESWWWLLTQRHESVDWLEHERVISDTAAGESLAEVREALALLREAARQVDLGS